jgi:MFS transporter, DHA2 family, multidrug resistance protein
LIAMLCLPGDSSAVMIGLRLGICGVGFGFFQAPNNRALMSSAPIDRAGAAAGLMAISRVTGQIAGAMLAALLFRIGGPVGRMAMGLAVLAGAFAAFLSFARRGTPSDGPTMVHRGGGAAQRPGCDAYG